MAADYVRPSAMASSGVPGGQILIDSYHCSRYNQNTGRLTREMFEAVFERAVYRSTKGS